MGAQSKWERPVYVGLAPPFNAEEGEVVRMCRDYPVCILDVEFDELCVLA